MLIGKNLRYNPVRDEYLINLARLGYRQTINVSTADDLQKYCPHLKTSQINELFKMARDSVVLFAIPAILLKKSFNILAIYSEQEDGKTQIVYKLTFAPTIKIKESLAGDLLSSQDAFNLYYLNQARKYADDNWPNSLVIDDWNDCQCVPYGPYK